MSVKVERQIPASGVWYEVMLSPFKTEEESWDYIRKYHRYYPIEEQNYRVSKVVNNSVVSHYFRGHFP